LGLANIIKEGPEFIPRNHATWLPTCTSLPVSTRHRFLGKEPASTRQVMDTISGPDLLEIDTAELSVPAHARHLELDLARLSELGQQNGSIPVPQFEEFAHSAHNLLAKLQQQQDLASVQGAVSQIDLLTGTIRGKLAVRDTPVVNNKLESNEVAVLRAEAHVRAGDGTEGAADGLKLVLLDPFIPIRM
jgi:hypothetical protein